MGRGCCGRWKNCEKICKNKIKIMEEIPIGDMEKMTYIKMIDYESVSWIIVDPGTKDFKVSDRFEKKGTFHY